MVFRGQLGNETDAVVVTTKTISEPNYIAFVNDTDYRYDSATDTFQASPGLSQTITQIGVKLGRSDADATQGALGVQKYAQFAFLTEVPLSGTERLVIDLIPAGIG